MRDEYKRLINPTNNKVVPKGWISTVIYSTFEDENSAVQACDRIIGVMKIISAYNSEKRWPSDAEWSDILPPWIKTSFHTYKPQELEQYLKDKKSLGWDFGSWLDALKSRVWEWWSMEINGKNVIFNLIVDGWPYSVEAFRHIVKAAGAIEALEKSD